jgi:hypothetical protein
MSKPFSVTFDPQKIYSEIQKSTDVALYEMAEKIIDDTEQFVPMKTGALRQSAKVEKLRKHGGIEISYERIIPSGVDVAPWLYNGLYYKTEQPVKNWTTPGTGGFWLEESEEENLEDWIEYFRERTREIWRDRK